MVETLLVLALLALPIVIFGAAFYAFNYVPNKLIDEEF